MDEQGRKAFRAEVCAAYDSLLRTAYLLTGDRADAQDLLRTALATAYLTWDRVREQEALAGHVLRVLVDTQTSWWRRRGDGSRADVPVERSDSDSDAGAGAGADAEAEAGAGAGADADAQADVGADLSDALWRALACLPRRQRAAVVLCWYQGLPEAEAAGILGGSVGRLRSTTSRALSTLRDETGLRHDARLALPRPGWVRATPSGSRRSRTGLDEQLRAVLGARAATLPPAPDPLAGVEERAAAIRRRRLTAVASTLAVALGAVGLLLALRTPPGGLPPAPATAPSSAPGSVRARAGADPLALDPAAPWPLRGDRSSLDGAARRAVERAVAERRGSGWTVTPLWSSRDGARRTAYVAVRAGRARWGVARTGADRARLERDVVLARGSRALLTTLDGDPDVLLVLAAPEVADVLYSSTGEPGSYRSISAGDPGVGLTEVPAGAVRDRVQVLAGPERHVVYAAPVPDPVRAATPARGDAP